MPDDQPTDSTEPTVPLEPSGEVETVGPETGDRGSRRVAVIASVAVAVVAVLGGGAYAAYSLLNGGGPQPADVLPASTIAVVSVDLDPSAGQKIAAIKSIRRFPALKRSLGLEADDDLREYVFDKVTAGSDCGLDFDRDVKSWLGKRAAFAGVDLGDAHPSPVIALQVSDAEKAQKGFAAIVDCTDPDDFAFVVGEDYLIASDSAEHAKAILDGGEDKPLAEDSAYQKWTGEAGDAGVLSFYVSKRAAEYAEDLLDDFSEGFTEGFTEGLAGDLGTEGDDESFADEDFGGSDPLDSVRSSLDAFAGLAGTVRFAGGGMEFSVAGGGLEQLSELATVGEQLGELPADTALALGFGITDDYAAETIEQLGGEGDEFVAEAESQTGLDLPEDLQTILGRAVILSLGGDAPDSLDELEAVDRVPAGLVIHGDADKIQDLIATAEDNLGVHLSDIPMVLDASGDKVAIATSRDYADELLKSGGLGSDGGFRDAVPDADEAAGILYADFDSEWIDLVSDLVASEEGESTGTEFEENVDPLRTLGLSTWGDGGTFHALLKVTTD